MKLLITNVFLFCTLGFSMMFHGTQAQPKIGEEIPAIIPRPQHIKRLDGIFHLTASTVICVDTANKELKRLGGVLRQSIKTSTGYSLRIVEQSQIRSKPNVIVLSTKALWDTLGAEGYALHADVNRLVIQAQYPAGIFYGIQTFLQLIPIEKTGKGVAIPAIDIVDRPRHPWRGMMLDAGRYFFSVQDVKKLIDYMVMYKLNTFQWHLTEDQGWRIEIKKYPRLTGVSAWRDSTLVGHLNDRPRKYDGKRHGGYYTQEQIKDVITYAAERYITIIPEIEMPGHSVAALASFPELSCTGGPFSVSSTWGVHEDVYCAGNEQTFVFLENVLSEVADLFPAPIIHIGGDECPKARWKACAKCQARMQQEGLKDEHALQSYFIRRIEKFLLTKNKTIIGWDEILEGGLAPGAMVMSWRGITGGIAAAQQHHGVVMTPRNPAYLDYYQSDPLVEPLTIHGLNTLRDVYAYDAVPAALSKTEAKYIMGSQANVWTEYMPTRERIEYMIMPRMAALSEVVWTDPAHKNWEDFSRRIQSEYQRYRKAGIRYAESAYNVRYLINFNHDQTYATVALHNDAFGAEIRYTIDETEPNAKATLYTGAIPLQAPTIINAASFVDGKQYGKTTTRVVVFNKAFNRNLTFNIAPDRRAVAGHKALVNGLKGNLNFRDGEWVGYYGKDLSVTIDLDTIVQVRNISASFLYHPESNAYLPETVSYAVSVDGERYVTMPITVTTKPSKHGGYNIGHAISVQPVRYIKIWARPRGDATWLYADEIVIE